ncbi:ParA family protein [Nocardia sp. 852002-51244_SCH5132740]|uniref:ParA family protein n=1 Tax=Nocardia sp. 852002-51244_SCH5132740 TaxID=1834099 RepID=UPI0007EBF138|nr:AAA family ATPase [Nocardia sp. 852002-51244_SCH5132740]OBB30576.1 hypothetical protein A5748_08650 [Nocardia sp. 852002-51244_SCH5132740]
MTEAVVVAMANQKGGVGKTTTTICLARAARRYHGARVLVVDMDPQGNASSSLAREQLVDDEVALADVITPDSDVALREVIVPTIWDGVDLAPGGTKLSVADRLIGAAPHGREYQLREAIRPVRGDYDLIIVDNPPSLLGQLLVNSLSAADAVVLVTEPHEWSSNGMALLGKTIAGVRKFYNPNLQIRGTIVNKWRNTKSGRRSVEEMTEGMDRHFPGVPVWVDRKIPNRIGITDTIEEGIALDESREAWLRVLSEDVFAPIAADMLKAGA